MSRILVLRPEPGASQTVKRARARGLDAVNIPLFEVEAVAWQPPEAGGFDALLLTSANALRFGGEQLMDLRGLAVHAVGEATAEAARHAGFDIASTGDDGVERLLGSLEAALRLLHLCGEHRSASGEPRQTITTVPVYRSKAIEPAPDVSEAADSVVMVHSPRAGRRFADLAEEQRLDRTRIAVVAISQAAGAATGSGWRCVEAADRPSDDALLALAERLCEKLRQG